MRFVGKGREVGAGDRSQMTQQGESPHCANQSRRNQWNPFPAPRAAPREGWRAVVGARIARGGNRRSWSGPPEARGQENGLSLAMLERLQDILVPVRSAFISRIGYLTTAIPCCYWRGVRSAAREVRLTRDSSHNEHANGP